MSNISVKYIIKSGPGYFVRLEDQTPVMCASRGQARRLTLAKGLALQDTLDRLGYNAELIVDRVADEAVNDEST